MVAVAEPAAAWVPVRCPKCNDMLGDVPDSAGAGLRKVCPRCRPKLLVLYDHSLRAYSLEPVDGTALAVVSASASRDAVDLLRGTR